MWRPLTNLLATRLQASASVDTPSNLCLPDTPLTPALHHLLQACVVLQTTNAKVLANHLNRSPHTVRTEFQRILSMLNVHSRYSALRVCEDEGWLHAEGTARHANRALAGDVGLLQPLE